MLIKKLDYIFAYINIMVHDISIIDDALHQNQTFTEIPKKTFTHQNY